MFVGSRNLNFGCHGCGVYAFNFLVDIVTVFRMLNVLDDYNHQMLHIEQDTCLPAQRIIRMHEQLEESRCLP